MSLFLALFGSLFGCSGVASSPTCSASGVGGGATDSCGTGGSGTGGAAVSPGNVQSIAVGDLAACALLNNKTIKCWGFNSKGQLGNGTTNASSTPVLVSGISNATSIASVGWHACAILSDATVKCWGQNDYQQLGSAVGATSLTPVAVPNVTNATALALGWNHTCALINDGTMMCWGRCSNKQCGTGLSSVTTPPTKVSGVTSVKAISAYDYHTCALLNAGSVQCWGETNLGTTATTVDHDPTTVVDGSQNAIAGITRIDSGLYADYASGTGSLYAWGNNNGGSLGDGTFATSRLTAAAVTGISNPISISGGYAEACAVLQDGTVQCWGENTSGEAGSDPNSYSTLLSPRQVSGIANVAQVSVGEGSACALRSDGNVYCWGNNYNGALGDGTTTNSFVPVHVIGL